MSSSEAESQTVEAKTTSGTSDAGSRRAGARVEISELVKTFRRASGETVRAVDGVSLLVEPGEMLVLLGPSGCGKTTLLRCIAGVEHPDSGSIRVDDRLMSSASERGQETFLQPEKRQLSMIFQSYALWPHMTAFANVAYPLRVRSKLDRGEIDDRVMSALKLVGIPELAKQHPTAMSGGQQQRVALARAIVGGDDLVLFDEPLSNVDAKVREELRFEIMEMHQRLGFTGIYVTHDQHEAMAIASRIAVMEVGKVAQIDTPREVYERPLSRYVATFVGTTNELEGKITRVDEQRIFVATDLGEVEAVRVDTADRFKEGSSVTVVSRPESWQIRQVDDGVVDHAPESNAWEGEVQHIQFAGSYWDISVSAGDTKLSVWSQGAPTSLDIGSRVVVSVPPADARAV